VIVGGHGFGGLFAAGLAAQKYDTGRSLSGIFTINSPMNGLVMSSPNDPHSELILNLVAGTYRNDLKPGNDFLNGVRSAVNASDAPVLSFASRCNTSDAVDQSLCGLSKLEEVFNLRGPLDLSGVKDNLHNSDGMFKVSTQAAVKDWRVHKNPKNTAVVFYDNRAYDEDLRLVAAPSILGHKECHETLSGFVQEPGFFVEAYSPHNLPDNIS